MPVIGRGFQLKEVLKGFQLDLKKIRVFNGLFNGGETDPFYNMFLWGILNCSQEFKNLKVI